MAEKGPPAPIPKPVRKPATQVKVKETSKKKHNPSKATPPLEPKRVVIPVVPIDQPEVPLYPPNQPNQVPDNPPDQPNQLPNNPQNLPNPPPIPPNLPPNQPPNNPPNPPNPPPIPPNLPPNIPNLPPDPPANPPNPIQPQNPPFQVPQFNWLYYKPEFSGKPQEDTIAHLMRTNDWMETMTFHRKQRYKNFA